MLKTRATQKRNITLLRGISYVFSILSYLQNEPLCKDCKAFMDVLESIRDKFVGIEIDVNKNRDIPQGIRELLTNIYVVHADLRIPGNPVKQKMLGNCHLPSGMCLAKSTKKFYEKLEKSVNEMEGLPNNG